MNVLITLYFICSLYVAEIIYDNVHTLSISHYWIIDHITYHCVLYYYNYELYTLFKLLYYDTYLLSDPITFVDDYWIDWIGF